jgi:5-hydroxyisourate hydrolase
MKLSTHVLDTARGEPAAGIAISLYRIDASARTLLFEATTNVDGRTDAPLATSLTPGTYELVFAVAPYFAATQTAGFYSDIPIRFELTRESERYHVPLLLSPWGYATYRGS